MLQAALRSGTADRRSVFEVFTRRLPEGRRYGVVAGTGRVLDAVENFRFDDDDPRTSCASSGIVDEPTLEWLADYRFRGDIWGYPEGEVYFPGSPILRVEGTFAECVLLETVILSILNHDSAVAAAASRMAVGGRRAPADRDGRAPHPRAGRGGRLPRRVRRRLRHHLRPGGRLPLRHPHRRHQRPRLHPAARQRAGRLHRAGRLARPRARRCWWTPTTSPRRSAPPWRSPGPELGAVRIDSGDLLLVAHRVRQQLDELGADGHQDRGDQRPGRVRHRLAGRGARWTRTASAPSW